MGLLDDADKRLSDRAEADEAAERAEEAKYIPWATDWSVELADLVRRKGFPLLPVYVASGLTPWQMDYDGLHAATAHWSAQNTNTYWGDAWPVMGWSSSSEWGPRAEQLLLSSDGSLWSLYATGAAVAKIDGIGKQGKPGNVVGGRFVRRIGIRSEHFARYFSVGSRPKAANAFGVYHGSGDLRDVLGVSVAAAIQAGKGPVDGWIIGVQ